MKTSSPAKLRPDLMHALKDVLRTEDLLCFIYVPESAGADPAPVRINSPRRGHVSEKERQRRP